MELEEMKALWGEMSAALEKQKTLTNTLIIKMTQVNYKNSLRKILLPEAAGALGCLLVVFYIFANISQLNTWYLMVCGIVSMVVLCVMPYLSVSAIRRLNRVNITGNNLKQTLLQYAKGKQRFVFAQKAGFYLGAVLLVTILPVMVAVMDGKDVFKTNWLWLYYAVCFPFFSWMAKWIYKYFLIRVAEAEAILKELEG